MVSAPAHLSRGVFYYIMYRCRTGYHTSPRGGLCQDFLLEMWAFRKRIISKGNRMGQNRGGVSKF